MSVTILILVRKKFRANEMELPALSGLACVRRTDYMQLTGMWQLSGGSAWSAGGPPASVQYLKRAGRPRSGYSAAASCSTKWQQWNRVVN